MTRWNWLVAAPIILIGVYIILYTSTRLIGAAWFRSKTDNVSLKKDAN